ncbi:MAG: helix-turn-helix domain-containing protein [Lysobacter sp.]
MNIPTLSSEELARRWQVTARTLRRWRDEGIGPGSFKVGRVVRYALDDVKQFEARSNGGATTHASAAAEAA